MAIRLFAWGSFALLLLDVGLFLLVLQLRLMVGQEEARVGYCPVGSSIGYKIDHPMHVLFQEKCAACHKYDARAIGPALGQIGRKRKKDWLVRWIHDSPKLIESGDSLAMTIFAEYQQTPCLPHPELSVGQIDSLIAFLDY